jgi:transcriptional regulator with XRE-family HTH domain
VDIKEKFGIRLKQLREERKLSQEQLANLSNIDRTYIPDIEKGRRNVSIVVVDKLARALDVSPQIFFDL